MRAAVLSDIHANLPALESVLTAVEALVLARDRWPLGGARLRAVGAVLGVVVLAACAQGALGDILDAHPDLLGIGLGKVFSAFMTGNLVFDLVGS